MRTLLTALLMLILIGAGSAGLRAQQRGEPAFVPKVATPVFGEGTGPVVMIDEAHNNYHTMEGRYKPFAELLRAHGCTVLPGMQPASAPTLASCDIYVIANALAAENVDAWHRPIRNAFGTEEIDAIARWVHEGGSLFLIVDHMPFPGAIDSLAIRFSIRFSDGFALYGGKPGRGLMFTRGNDNLRPHWITDTPVDGTPTAGARIDSVVTFTGSAFQVERAHDPLLVFGAGMESLEPQVAWEFDDKTRRIRIEGWRHGAALEYGKGRVVVFGEAALFSAQRSEQGLPIGMNTPEGQWGAPLLVNIIRWLAAR